MASAPASPMHTLGFCYIFKTELLSSGLSLVYLHVVLPQLNLKILKQRRLIYFLENILCLRMLAHLRFSVIGNKQRAFLGSLSKHRGEQKLCLFNSACRSIQTTYNAQPAFCFAVLQFSNSERKVKI